MTVIASACPEAAIAWSRYAELFSYDEQSETFSLEEAE